jgi:hypothetical protein
VREWQIVTVAFARRRSSAAGLPTIVLRRCDRPLPLERYAVLLEERHDPERRRRDEGRLVEVELARARRVEAVDVLARRDCPQDAALVDLVGKRQLNEDPVDRVVGVQLADQGEQIRLRRVRRQLVVVGGDPGLARGLVLPADVNVRRGVVSDEHRGEPERADLGHLGGDLGPDPRGGEPAPSIVVATIVPSLTGRSPGGPATTLVSCRGTTCPTPRLSRSGSSSGS